MAASLNALAPRIPCWTLPPSPERPRLSISHHARSYILSPLISCHKNHSTYYITRNLVQTIARVLSARWCCSSAHRAFPTGTAHNTQNVDHNNTPLLIVPGLHEKRLQSLHNNPHHHHICHYRLATQLKRAEAGIKDKEAVGSAEEACQGAP